MWKAKDRYHNGGGGKENAAEYDLANKEVLRENAKNKYSNLSEEKKKWKKNMEEIDIELWQKIKKNRLKNIKENTKKQKSKILMFLHRIKMSGKTLKFGDVEVNKKEFHASKQLLL